MLPAAPAPLCGGSIRSPIAAVKKRDGSRRSVAAAPHTAAHRLCRAGRRPQAVQDGGPRVEPNEEISEEAMQDAQVCTHDSRTCLSSGATVFSGTRTRRGQLRWAGCVNCLWGLAAESGWARRRRRTGPCRQTLHVLEARAACYARRWHAWRVGCGSPYCAAQEGTHLSPWRRPSC